VTSLRRSRDASSTLPRQRTLGSGKRLFEIDGPETKLALLGTEAFTSGAVHLTYGPAE